MKVIDLIKLFRNSANPAKERLSEKVFFAACHLSAKEALMKKGVDFDGLVSYSFQLHKAGRLYIIAYEGKGNPKIINITNEFIKLTEKSIRQEVVYDELALAELECQPGLQPSKKSNLKRRKKSNLVRDAAREIISNSSSSSDEQADPKKPNITSANDEAQKPAKKPTTKKSKHQGKAKTFKRKTQRRGRV